MATPSIGPPPAAPPGAMAAAGGGRGNPHQNRALHVTGIRYFSWALKRFPYARGRLRRRNGVGVSMLTHGTRIMCFFSPMVDEALLGEIFGAFGQLVTCKIVRDANGVHGYCDFADYTSARYLTHPCSGASFICGFPSCHARRTLPGLLAACICGRNTPSHGLSLELLLQV